MTGQQSTCYHALLRIIPICDLFRILTNILFLNKKLHTFGIKPSPLCSFCNLYDETPLHIFYECDAVKRLYLDLVQCFQNNSILPNFNTTICHFSDS